MRTGHGLKTHLWFRLQGTGAPVWGTTEACGGGRNIGRVHARTQTPYGRVGMALDEGMEQYRNQTPPATRPHHIRTGDGRSGGTLQVGDPPGDIIPVEFYPFPIDDSTPNVDEIG